MKKIIVSFLLLSVLFMPALAFAQPGVTINSLDQLVTVIKRPLWVVFGLIALIAFVISGILFLTAAGNPGKIAQARTAFLWGVVGVVVGTVLYSIITVMDIVISEINPR